MSAMENNTHIATAKFRQEGVHEWQSREGETDATCIAAALDAQTEASLALAYEQRTANLIAAMQPVNLPDGEALGLTIQKCAQIHAQITERLGLA